MENSQQLEKEYYDRLRELGDLYRAEIISSEEYENRKIEIKKQFHM